jgi:hypothetical protein
MTAAAGTAYGSNFDSSGNPLIVYAPPSGSTYAPLGKETIPETAMDHADDYYWMVAVPEGKTIDRLEFDVGAYDTHATPTLDMDIVLGVFDKDGNITETVLYNAGADFQDGGTDVLWPAKKVEGSALGYGLVGFHVNTAVATYAAVVAVLDVRYH